MKLAIEEAKKSSERLPCGAVIIKKGEIIAIACNTGKTTFDASGHAEINAIREAGQKLGSKRLDSCEIYCTCEPCIMCLSAICFARIEKIYYGLTLKEVSPMNRIINIDISTFLKKSPHKIEVVDNFMKKECGCLMTKFYK